MGTCPVVPVKLNVDVVVWVRGATGSSISVARRRADQRRLSSSTLKVSLPGSIRRPVDDFEAEFEPQVVFERGLAVPAVAGCPAKDG